LYYRINILFRNLCMSKNNRFIFKSLLLICGFSFLGNTFPLYGTTSSEVEQKILILDEDENDMGKKPKILRQIEAYETSSQTQREILNRAAQPALTTRGGVEEDEEFFDAEDGGEGVTPGAAEATNGNPAVAPGAVTRPRGAFGNLQNVAEGAFTRLRGALRGMGFRRRSITPDAEETARRAEAEQAEEFFHAEDGVEGQGGGGEVTTAGEGGGADEEPATATIEGAGAGEVADRDADADEEPATATIEGAGEGGGEVTTAGEGEVGDTTAGEGEGGDTTAGEGEGGYCAIM
jgi:hypothetical protein